MAESMMSESMSPADYNDELSCDHQSSTTADRKEVGRFKSAHTAGRSVIINRPREELYQFWRDFSNLATFMRGVRGVQSSDPDRAHWLIGAEEGDDVEWDTVVTEDIPNQLIAWRTPEHSHIEHEGRVEFRDAPGGRGTIVTATVICGRHGGAIGEFILRLFHKDQKTQTQRELRRFKQLMETGEIAAVRARAPSVASLAEG